MKDETYPFSGKIQVGDWVRGRLVHQFITDYQEHMGIVTFINPDGDILHVTDPVYNETRVIGMKYVIDYTEKVEK